VFSEDEMDQARLKDVFRPLTPHIKACTMKSFKGWEIPHLVVAIPAGTSLTREDHAEIYMAITRTKHDLIVINANSELNEAEDFFHT
jgi:hypothetical protein